MIKYLICFKSNASGKESIYNLCASWNIYQRKNSLTIITTAIIRCMGVHSWHSFAAQFKFSSQSLSTNLLIAIQCTETLNKKRLIETSRVLDWIQWRATMTPYIAESVLFSAFAFFSKLLITFRSRPRIHGRR